MAGDAIQPQIMVDQRQPRAGRHVSANKTDGLYFVSSCNQSAFFISHLYKPFGIRLIYKIGRASCRERV